MSDDNWLGAEVFDCPNCKNKLFKVGHSPFADDDVFYCDSCPKRVDVSFYDKRSMKITDEFSSDGKTLWENKIKAIESHLRECDCGGKFNYHSPRRCPYCSAPVVVETSSFELYPAYFYYEEDRDPTQIEREKVEKFTNEFIITNNIWKEN